jgi:deoxyribodipyrimidine photo-lyase
MHQPEAARADLLGDESPVLCGTLLPTLSAAHARIAAVRPAAYARTRNALDGAVSGLSPYLTHGFVSLRDVLAGVSARHDLDMQHKFVLELGWRAFFRHVWQQRGAGILQSLHAGPLPDVAYARALPDDICTATTGVPVVDMAVRELHASGTLHNHARMWLASYMVHVRKVHWRAGADWLYIHLLDGDLASNHLSWQWVAGTGSSKPYLFNADNVARYAPPGWHSPGSVIDTSYEALDQLARQPQARAPLGAGADPASVEPARWSEPPAFVGATRTDPAALEGRDVWLVHPWNLGELPAGLSRDTLVIGLLLSDFHQAWPWSERRWRFVGSRMAELTSRIWQADAVSVSTALKGATRVRGVAEPHLADWPLAGVQWQSAPDLFPAAGRACDSFSSWWRQVSRGLDSARELLQR